MSNYKLETVSMSENPDFLNKESLGEMITELRSQYDEQPDNERDYKRELMQDIKKISAFIQDMEEEGCDDWEIAGLVREPLFEGHIREQINDCYDLESVPAFIRSNIDWAGVAQDCQHDYSCYEFNGETYLGQ